jgi:hypothetical protein
VKEGQHRGEGLESSQKCPWKGWQPAVDGSIIGKSLIRVDALAGLFAVEEVGNKFNDMGNTSETTDHIISWTFDLSILESRRSIAEEILSELLKMDTSKGSVDIDTLEEPIRLKSKSILMDVWHDRKQCGDDEQHGRLGRDLYSGQH